jgi:ATP phosphoribosyltransferase
MMRIAIPKGRLQRDVLSTFAAAGYETPSADDLCSRSLIFQRGGIEWILVKDSDVPVYIEHGGADAGVAGSDQITESGCTAWQPIEMPYGRCRMMVIGAPGASMLSPSAAAKVATKYPRTARDYLDARRIRAEVVPLAGSVELAAVLALTSHVIDLVETGETVRVHRLELQDLVAEVTPRLVVARNAYRTNRNAVRELIARIEGAVNGMVERNIA